MLRTTAQERNHHLSWEKRCNMLKSHEIFHSANGKRLILIAEDEFINREILKGILQDDYELVFAENGKEALDLIRERADMLSLVIWTSYERNGRPKTGAGRPGYVKIPVIVMIHDRPGCGSQPHGRCTPTSCHQATPKPDVIRAAASLRPSATRRPSDYQLDGA